MASTNSLFISPEAEYLFLVSFADGWTIQERNSRIWRSQELRQLKKDIPTIEGQIAVLEENLKRAKMLWNDKVARQNKYQKEIDELIATRTHRMSVSQQERREAMGARVSVVRDPGQPPLDTSEDQYFE
jgi:hypothetical protein